MGRPFGITFTDQEFLDNSAFQVLNSLAFTLQFYDPAGDYSTTYRCE